MKMKIRKPQARTMRLKKNGETLVLWLAIGNNADAYVLTPISHDYGRAAFRLHKAYDGKHAVEEYDVLLDSNDSSCSCKGFLHHGMKANGGTGCKHVAALTKLHAMGRI